MTQQVLNHTIASSCARFRHVVFKSSGRGRAVNLAPRAGHAAAAPLPPPPPFHPRAPHLSPNEAHFVTWLFERGGLDACAYRQETLRRRLPACLRTLRAASVAKARVALHDNPAAIADAINTMVIGVTSFFRDATVFDHLTYTVLPALPRTRAQPRIWSAGCSDGQELYSVAMLLAEMNLLDGSHLLGTDCRPQALVRARAGRYPLRMLRDLPRAWQEKYFDRDGDASARVRPELRAAVQWRTGDVTRLCEPGTWDLIFCRNLAMYLRPQVAGRVWNALENALRPGGFLVLGKAERPSGTQRLGLVTPCIYRRDRA